MTARGSGFATKRLSKGRFKWWPSGSGASANPACTSGAVTAGGRGIRTRKRFAGMAAGERVKEYANPLAFHFLTLPHCEKNAGMEIPGPHTVTAEEIDFIRRLIAEYPTASRRKVVGETLRGLAMEAGQRALHATWSAVAIVTGCSIAPARSRLPAIRFRPPNPLARRERPSRRC